MAVDAVVMGLGRFGGGLAAAESLLAEGRQVLVTDLAEEAALQAVRHQAPGDLRCASELSTWGPRARGFCPSRVGHRQPRRPPTLEQPLSPDRVGVRRHRHHRNRTHAGSTQ